MDNKKYFWFVVGSQFLYGDEVLDTVAARAQEMAETMSKSLPFELRYKGIVKTWDEATKYAKEANFDDGCCGMVTWCHTFSPSKMWIEAFRILQKPLLHFATQYNRYIPDKEIDMDFMNLNQAAHGDREHGFIIARMRLQQKIVTGFWKDQPVLDQIGTWMRAAVAYDFSRNLRVMRFGDNMREVAVTEGDKVEAQIKFGWQVNTWPVGSLVDEMNKVTEDEIDELMKVYTDTYELATDDLETVRYQAREEIAIKKMMDREGAKAFVNTFQDLVGMKQLPGIASQHLMAQGYGYGAEGDWKLSALTSIVKKMTEGMNGGSSFMEDYTYHLDPEAEYALGAHMLEVCPSIAAAKPRIEVHPLGIGDREDPARLVFEGHEGNGVVVTMIDMGERFRMIVQDIHCVKPIYEMPNLPTARVMWEGKPSLNEGLKMWLMAGGAHHSVLSYDATPEMLQDLARMMDIEFVHISADSKVEAFEKDLMFADLAWKLR